MRRRRRSTRMEAFQVISDNSVTPPPNPTTMQQDMLDEPAGVFRLFFERKMDEALDQYLCTIRQDVALRFR